MTIVLVVVIVWTLVAIVALAFVRTLCAAAARADAEQVEQRVRRPVEAPRYTHSASPDPIPAKRVARPGMVASLRAFARR